MRKLLDVNSHGLFPAKVYFLIKWTDKSIGYKQTAILKLLYLNPVLGSVRVLFHTAYLIGNTRALLLS